MEEYEMIRIRDIKKFLTDFTIFLKNVFLYACKSVLQSLLLVIISILLVMGAGYFYQEKNPAYYQAEMVCVYNNLHKKTFGEMVHRLDELAKRQSYHQLSETLQLPVETASAIIGFDAKNVAGSPLYEDVTSERTPMYFALKAKNKSLFPEVQNALLHYMNNVPYQTKRMELEQRKLNDKIVFIENDLSKIDTMIIAYSSFLYRTRPATDSAAGFSNIVELFRYKDQLEDKMLELEKNKNLTASVEMIYGFAPPDAPVKADRKFWIRLVLFALIFSVTGAVIRKMLKDE